MALTAEEVVVKSIGDVWSAAAGTAAPDVEDLDSMSALEGAGWSHMGWIQEEGPTFPGFEPQIESILGWNRQGAITEAYTISEDARVVVPFLQFTAEVLQLYFPGATHDAVNGTIDVTDYATPTPVALLVTIGTGSKTIGFWAGSTSPRGEGELSFPDDDGAPMPVGFSILAPSSGQRFRVLGINVAAGSSPS